MGVLVSTDRLSRAVHLLCPDKFSLRKCPTRLTSSDTNEKPPVREEGSASQSTSCVLLRHVVAGSRYLAVGGTTLEGRVRGKDPDLPVGRTGESNRKFHRHSCKEHKRKNPALAGKGVSHFQQDSLALQVRVEVKGPQRYSCSRQHTWSTEVKVTCCLGSS